MGLVILLLYDNLFIYQVICTLIYRRRSLCSFLFDAIRCRVTVSDFCFVMVTKIMLLKTELRVQWLSNEIRGYNIAHKSDLYGISTHYHCDRDTPWNVVCCYESASGEDMIEVKIEPKFGNSCLIADDNLLSDVIYNFIICQKFGSGIELNWYLFLEHCYRNNMVIVHGYCMISRFQKQF